MVRIRVRVGPKGQEELVSEEEYHGKLLVRVGPKGEVIIPRALGEAYRVLKGVLLLKLAE